MAIRVDGGVLVKVGSSAGRWDGLVVVPASKCHHFACLVARSHGFLGCCTQAVAVGEDVSSLEILEMLEV